MDDPYLMLALAEGFGEAPIAALLAPDVDPGAILASPPRDLPPRVLRRLGDRGLPTHAAAVAAAAAAMGLCWLTPRDPGWPRRLDDLPQRPLGLFLRGNPAALLGAPAVAVVGSRAATPYGLAAAEAFATALARAGLVLWSGLARGIDALAHRAALQAGSPTVAVLAGGLDRIYPPEHNALAAAIADAGGCLVSELPPGRRARRGHFPRRNRILAAGAHATLVVEAGLASGALHTARFAAECGREVHAVPGPWSSAGSRGCHRLLQEGARVASDPVELLRDLGVQAASPPATALTLVLAADGEAIVQVLQRGPRPADLVQRECGLERPRFLRARFELEQRGLVRTLPGDLLALAVPAVSDR